MKISKPQTEAIKGAFKAYDQAPTMRDKAFRMIDIIDLFHTHYMEKIEIILGIAGEMQKHFKEEK